MGRKFLRGIALVAAVLGLLGALTATAYANLDSEPAGGIIHGSSASNPGSGDSWWRQGWGRSLTPDMSLLPPEGMDEKLDGLIIGMLYNVDRTPSACATGTMANSIINTGAPENYYLSSYGGASSNAGPYGTNTENTIDLLGIYANPPLGGWPVAAPNTAQPVEGQWYLHYRYFSSRASNGFSDAVHTVSFGVDTTPPSPVTGLIIRTGLSSSPVTTWQPLQRAHVTWDPAAYDALSGVGYYQVLVDDKPLIPEKGASPEQGRVYSAPWLPTPSSITVENMPPGKHKISVVAVDRATNRSVATSGDYYSDPDVPTVAFTSPITGYLKESADVSVDASDSAGAPRVSVALDGVTVASFTAPPYRFRPNLTGVAPGAHTLTATATDKLGRIATTTLAVSTLGATAVNGEGYLVTDDEGLNTPVSGVTATNPDSVESPDTFWRQGWGNSLNPQFELSPGSAGADLGFVSGMLYAVDRTESTNINATKPNDYFRSARSEGTNLDQTINLIDVFTDPPVGGWPNNAVGGEVAGYEGKWYFHVLPFTTRAYAPQNTTTLSFGVDVTAPHAVSGLKASPTLDRADADAWTSKSRAHVTWTADVYDSLSGVAYYKVLLDDEPIIPDGTDTTQGRIYEVIGRTPASVTIEKMPVGPHKISVIAVDRATNEGAAAITYFHSDSDVPTISFLASTATILQVKPSLGVAAADLGGIKNVIYRLDGRVIGTTVSAPYGLRPDLSGFPAGTHVLSATVTDMLDRTAAVSKTITLDKTPLRLSSFSRTPSVFYPIKRDRYYDNSAIRYTLNKTAVAKLTVRTSKGKTVRTISGTRRAGRNSFVWDGKWASDKKAHTGTYTYQITAVDSAGFMSSTYKLKTTIRNYQIIKTGRSSVRVIRR